ncbi:helix-turn-helix domain-containing protein [Actinokineospora enzanensis]|uniref:helix-turn-helix domain-containing protein n=1 Tax=Actinokineospora enzanensis TaxID=155975 RepID=UPI0003779060|nr:helix-turn-helix transcriptional regulator [Actinokineospora enzanensis]
MTTTAYKATVRRRELGLELREVRDKFGISMCELARRLGWEASKLSRIENGKLPCSEVEAAIILAYCKVTGRRLDEILRLCAGDADGTWVRENGCLPDQLRTLILHETIAETIYEVELNRVPGLLQTEDYARAVITGPGLVPFSLIEGRVQARMERQTLIRRENPPRVIFYIHEQALHLPVADDKAMHEQMLQLLFLGARPGCDIRIIPRSAGAHAALDCPFRLMQYSDAQPVVSLETQNRTLFLESATDIATYRLILGRLADAALSREQSRSVLADIASVYERAGAHDHDDQDGLA